jgi:hypothetical protein
MPMRHQPGIFFFERQVAHVTSLQIAHIQSMGDEEKKGYIGELAA